MTTKKKVFIITIFIFALITSFSASFFYFRNVNRAGNGLQVAPSITPTPTFAPLSKSPYATDAAILKMKNDIKDSEKQLNSLNLKESQLLPPVLDYEVKLEE